MGVRVPLGELAALRGVVTGSSVNVEVDAKPQEDLSKVMEEIRAQYEGVNEKNRREMEAWYKLKFDELNKEVVCSTETLQSSQSEISELRRTLQALQIELQSQLSMKSNLESQLGETESRYSLKLSQLQQTVHSLENELGLMRTDIERQSSEYRRLLDIKTRLEMEIAEYRRLLDGEAVQKVQVVEVVEEKRKPVTWLTSAWFFFRNTSSSFRPSTCISRSERLMVRSSRTFLSPAVSASTDMRMAISFSNLPGDRGVQAGGETEPEEDQDQDQDQRQD
ncbi:unnamed protein product [Menidia menidia]|uniref:(Atlantic silverside) hypothetical protein n=1 Tax=Menidia menidia TaxID=238744 RepID=A0A8S4BEQ8_9TELE|nr:unnamed protein product [Menidia menidia]